MSTSESGSMSSDEPQDAVNVTAKTVGLIGLGHMGLPMARRLVAAGYQVHGSDPAPAARAAAADASIAVHEQADAVARACEVVILMLPNSDIVDAVARSIVAVPESERAVRTIIDMSSSEPLRTRELAAELAADDILLLDAPVSGGVVKAVSGELTIMVGGSEAGVETIQPILAPLGSQIIHVGGVGAGHAAKALNNLLSAAHLVASAEAMVVGVKFGIAPEALLAVINTSSGRSGSTELKLPRYILPGTFDSGFSSALLEKDVKIATKLSSQVDVATPLADAVQANLTALNADLDASADHTEVIRPIERRAGVTVRSTPPVS